MRRDERTGAAMDVGVATSPTQASAPLGDGAQVSGASRRASRRRGRSTPSRSSITSAMSASPRLRCGVGDERAPRAVVAHREHELLAVSGKPSTTTVSRVRPVYACSTALEHASPTASSMSSRDRRRAAPGRRASRGARAGRSRARSAPAGTRQVKRPTRRRAGHAQERRARRRRGARRRRARRGARRTAARPAGARARLPRARVGRDRPRAARCAARRGRRCRA